MMHRQYDGQTDSTMDRQHYSRNDRHGDGRQSDGHVQPRQEGALVGEVDLRLDLDWNLQRREGGREVTSCRCISLTAALSEGR